MYKRVIAVTMAILMGACTCSYVENIKDSAVVSAQETTDIQCMDYNELSELPCETVERKVKIKTSELKNNVPVVVNTALSETEAYLYNGFLYLKGDANEVYLIGYTGKEDIFEVPTTINNYTVSHPEEYLQYNFIKNVKKIKLHDGITSVAEEQFKDFLTLEEVLLPDGVIKIGKSAFSGCSNLKKINFPTGLKSIEGYAFYGCNLLEDINLPSSLKNIGTDAFSDWKGNIKIPEGVNYLAFSFVPSRVDSIQFASKYMKRQIYYYENGDGYCEFYKPVNNTVSGTYKNSKIKGIISKLNSTRKALGKKELKYSSELTQTARKKVTYVAENGGNSDAGSIPKTDAGYKNGYYCNGFTSYNNMIKQINSEMKNNEYYNIGVACASVEGKMYYYVIMTINDQGTTASPLKLKDSNFTVTHRLRGNEIEKIKASGITIKKGSTKSIKTRVKEFGISNLFAGSVEATDLSFKSSKSSVAKVGSNGKVSGVKKGTAKLTITLKSNTAIKTTVTVTVK